MFDNIQEVKQAIDNGKKIYWKQSNYEVIKDRIGQYMVMCHNNGNCQGLFWQDGINSEFDPKDFYTSSELIGI